MCQWHDNAKGCATVCDQIAAEQIKIHMYLWCHRSQFFLGWTTSGFIVHQKNRSAGSKSKNCQGLKLEQTHSYFSHHMLTCAENSAFCSWFMHLFKAASTLGMNIKTWMNNKEYGILVFTILETHAMIGYNVFTLKILRFISFFPVMLYEKVTGKLSVLYLY